MHSLSCFPPFPPTASDVLILQFCMETRTVPKAISCATNSSSVELKKMAFYNFSIIHILHGQPCRALKRKLFSMFCKKEKNNYLGKRDILC